MGHELWITTKGRTCWGVYAIGIVNMYQCWAPGTRYPVVSGRVEVEYPPEKSVLSNENGYRDEFEWVYIACG